LACGATLGILGSDKIHTLIVILLIGAVIFLLYIRSRKTVTTEGKDAPEIPVAARWVYAIDSGLRKLFGVGPRPLPEGYGQ